MYNTEEITEELKTLRKLRSTIDERIRQLEGKLQYKTALRIKSNGALQTGIPTTEIKPYVQEWVDQGHTLVALAHKANVSESTIDNIMQKPDSMVRTSTADAVLTALGLPHVLNRILPDPPEGHFYEE